MFSEMKMGISWKRIADEITEHNMTRLGEGENFLRTDTQCRDYHNRFLSGQVLFSSSSSFFLFGPVTVNNAKWTLKLKQNLGQVPWTKDEDKCLLSVVDESDGDIEWIVVSEEVRKIEKNTRTASQCFERFEILSPLFNFALYLLFPVVSHRFPSLSLCRMTGGQS